MILNICKEFSETPGARYKNEGDFSGEEFRETLLLPRFLDAQEKKDKLAEVVRRDFTGISFLNLVDFDANFGHRRDPIGYGKALEQFDARLPEVLEALDEDDLMIITADHGNDPTFPGTDHTREFVPLLVYSPRFKVGAELPLRNTFADIGATIAENFGVAAPAYGTSFLQTLSKEG